MRGGLRADSAAKSLVVLLLLGCAGLPLRWSAAPLLAFMARCGVCSGVAAALIGAANAKETAMAGTHPAARASRWGVGLVLLVVLASEAMA